MKQFMKWFKTLNNSYTTDTEQRMQGLAWRECCNWFLELEKMHSPEKIKELIYAELDMDYYEPCIKNGDMEDALKPDPRPDGHRAICQQFCSVGQRLICRGEIKVNNVIQPFAECGAAKEEHKEQVVNEANCKHSASCPRGCKVVDLGTPPLPQPMWFESADAHRNGGWVPCDRFINPEDTKKFHCAHVILNRKGNFLMDGYELVCCLRNLGEDCHACKGYSACDRYHKGNKI